MKIKFQELVRLHHRVIHVEQQNATEADISRESRYLDKLSPSVLATVCPACFSELAQNVKNLESWQQGRADYQGK